MQSPKNVPWLALTLSGVALLGCVTLAVSQQQKDEHLRLPEDVEKSEEEETTVRLGALEVAVDPETGDIRPLTNREAAQLAREMRRRFRHRDIGEPTLRSDGAMSLVVVPNVLSYSTARVQPDGSVALDCAGSTEDAIEHLTHLVETRDSEPQGAK